MGQFVRLGLSVFVAATVVVSVVAFVFFDAGPIHVATCLVGGRNGWDVEYPRDAAAPDDVLAIMPSCVPVQTAYVDCNQVPEGDLAIVPVGRDWFALDGSLTLWVEGSTRQAAAERARNAAARVGDSPVPPAAMPLVECPAGKRR